MATEKVVASAKLRGQFLLDLEPLLSARLPKAGSSDTETVPLYFLIDHMRV